MPAPGRVCIPGRVYASVCIRGCIHFFLPVSAWFRRSGDGPGACMHCMHHSLIEDSKERKETPYIDAYNAYKRKEFCFFPLYIRVFGLFPSLFCMHPRMHTDAYTHTRRPEELHNAVKSAHAAPRHREPPGSPAKRIGGSPDVLPTPKGGGTLTAKRWPAVAGIGPCMHSGSRVCICMHPGMHTFFPSVSACFRRSGDGPGACMHCMHHSLIEDSKERKETPYIDAYNAYKRKEFCFFLYI